MSKNSKLRAARYNSIIEGKSRGDLFLPPIKMEYFADDILSAPRKQEESIDVLIARIESMLNKRGEY